MLLAGKARRGKPRLEPDRGNLSVRDFRGAWGTVEACRRALPRHLMDIGRIQPAVSAARPLPTRRAATKAALHAGESPAPLLVRFERIADQTRKEVTNFGQALVTKPSLLHGTCAVFVGTARRASKPGGRNIMECLQPRNLTPCAKLFAGIWYAPSRLGMGEGRRRRGRNGHVHAMGTRGKGRSTQGM